MSEQEWRSIGVQQSKGWVHYMTHAPGKSVQVEFTYQSDKHVTFQNLIYCYLNDQLQLHQLHLWKKSSIVLPDVCK